MNPESGPSPEDINFKAEEGVEQTKQPDDDHLPEQIIHLTPYEEARKIDSDYENPKTLHHLTEQELQHRIDEYTKIPEYKDYQNLHLNFDKLDQMLEHFDHNYGPEHQQLSEKLKQAISEIKYSASKYYKSVMTFDRTSINKYRMEAAEYKEEMMRVDTARRVAHNKLIDDVFALSRLCYREIPAATGHRFDKSELFDQHLIQDLRSDNRDLHRSARDKIANWAFINERGIHVAKTVGQAKEILEKKKAA